MTSIEVREEKTANASAAGPVPMPGDAVRLATTYADGWVPKGAIGILEGYDEGTVVGRPLQEYLCCFNFSAFRGSTRGSPEYVRCSGGPLPCVAPADLVATGETVEVRFWRWKDGIMGAGRADNYTLAVPLWEWTPKATP